MDLDTWVSLGALLSVGAVLIGYIRASMRDLKDELKADIEKLDGKIDEARKEAKIDIEKLRHEVKSEIGALREHVDHGFARIDGRLDVLEQRTYDIKPTGT